MFYSRLCVILILAVNLINALPVPPTSDLERRVTDAPRSSNPKDWPSEEKLKESLKTEPNRAEFWTGTTKDHTGTPISAQHSADAHAKANGGTTIDMALHDGGHKMPEWTDPAGEAKWVEASKAYAHGASGDVHAHVGQDVRPGSTYFQKEKPILENNPKVTSITEHAHGQPAVPPVKVHEKKVSKL